MDMILTGLKLYLGYLIGGFCVSSLVLGLYGLLLFFISRRE